MNKSYVSAEQKQCAVCGELYSTNSILFDRRVKNSLEPTTVTGLGLCEEHQKLKDDGYVALIEMIGSERTGKVMHIRKEVLSELITIPVPEHMVMLVVTEAFVAIELMYKKALSGDAL